MALKLSKTLAKRYLRLPEDGNPFQGFQGCSEALTQGGNESLVWKGALHLSKNIWSALSEVTNDTEMEVLQKVLLEVHDWSVAPTYEDPAPFFVTICKIFWNVINRYAARKLEAKKRNAITFDNIINRITIKEPNNDYLYVTSREFVEDFLEDPHKFGMPGIAHYTRDLKDQFGRNAFVQLRKQLVLHFEAKMYKSKQLGIMYPAREKVFVVLPYFGCEEDNFEVYSRVAYINQEKLHEKQRKIKALYNLAYKNYFLVNYCDDAVLHQAIVKFSRKSRQAFELNDDANYYDLSDILLWTYATLQLGNIQPV